MQNDEVIWGVIGSNHCSYRTSTATENFCRNPYNVTGLCNRRSCPLANSRYATIIEKEGVCYLYKKVPERAHTPKNLWERVKLLQNYEKALDQIQDHLEYWPEFLIHKNKQRFTKIVQYIIRKKKIQKHTDTNIVVVKKKTERREKQREEHAERAAQIEIAIEKELFERLKNGTYEDIYNYPPQLYNKWLDKNKVEEVEYVEEDIQESDQEIEDLDQLFQKKSEYEIEYEHEIDQLNNLH
jgi:protein MAK16